MAAMEESPLSSPVSADYAYASVDSDPESVPRATHHPLGRGGAHGAQRAAKRLKLSDDMHTSPEMEAVQAEEAPLSPISSDTSGDIPNSPSVLRADEEDAHQEQVTVCSWDGCSAGDLGNMDRLVDHIHNSHIENRAPADGRSEVRQKKYTCEWDDCSRKGMAHASAYALKAHMRSHTREKPFYCVVPECDRAFTRSDALQKHMRTVHETEAPRPVPPESRAVAKLQAKAAGLHLVLTPGQTPSRRAYDALPPLVPGPDGLTAFPADVEFTDEELQLSPHELWRLLRRQVHWAGEEADLLRREVEMAEAARRAEWLEKEVLLDQMIQSEMDWYDRRKVVLAAESARLAAAASSSSSSGAAGLGAAAAKMDAAEADLDLDDGAPDPDPDAELDADTKDDQEEAAAVLASLHQG